MNESNEEALTNLINAIKKEAGETKRLGSLSGEPGIGNLVDEWGKIIGGRSDISVLDCSILIDDVLTTKEPEELDCIKIASKYACFIMENLNKKFENIIDDDKKVSHETIANEIRVLTEKPQFLNKFREKYKINPNADLQLLELYNTPVIQSGGNYDLNSVSENDNRKLSSDVIICKVNTRFKDYNANIIRTFMIDAEKSQQNFYKILFEAFNFLVSSISEGAKLSTIYEKVKEFILSKDSSLEANIPDNFGFGLGLERPNSALIINNTNDKKISPGMAFNLIMSLNGLQTGKGFTYSLQIADTLAIKQNNNRENYSLEVSKTLSDIYYNMEDEEVEKKEKPETSNKMVVEDGKRRTRSAVVGGVDQKAQDAQRRKDHQMELLERKNLEFKERMNAADQNQEISVAKKMVNNIKSYRDRASLPSDIQPGKIYVDSKNDTVILPIFKLMVPFHISFIKNVSKSDENSFAFLRINFITPISGLNPASIGDTPMDQPVYIKDLTYKSRDLKNFSDLFNKIKDLIKKVKVKDQEDREKSDLVVQENLVLLKGKRIFLKDVTVRPNITSKKTSGILEAHQNGFRFVSAKGEKIDIIYKNIRHAFFQPCENELIVLVHFNLKNPILVGKKKTLDVQFYREVGSQADDLDFKKRGNDYEEYEIELKERQQRDRMNEEFLSFTKQVEQIKEFEFDVPSKDLAFSGVPHKSNVTLVPTAFCLVSLIELPFFVIALEEIELVYFERVSHSIKNFDMSLVFKDLNKPVHRIGTIPMEHLETIKSWLDDCDILFSEGLYNMNWANIIQKIKKNPEEFIEDGGWNFLIDDANNSNAEQQSGGGDSDFEESDYDEEEEEEYIEEESEYSDSDVEGGDSDLSEEGLSWDELEEKAEKEDREKTKRIVDEETQNKNAKKRGKK